MVSMASSSSSHQQNQRFNAFSRIEPDGKRRKVSESSTLFDVFINHRGPDVKLTLATHLYNSLKEVGIRTFLDSEEKELGESFPSTIETAIKSAKVHIAIFSKRYAESPWCLAELLLMSQTQAKIIPVFYDVQPWELRFIEKGQYASAFIEYENKERYLEKLPEWKEALQSLSFVAGEEFNGDYKNIIASVQKEVKKKICLHVATYPVGLDNLVEDFQRRCLNELVLDFENQCGLEEGKHKAKVVGIFGMGGVGKTTLAKELFNRKSLNYCRASFLFDVREASVTGRLPSLQGKLLKDLFHNHSLNPTSTEEGMSYLKDHLQRSPDVSFLIVVDDIDHVEQLNALVIMNILNKFCNTLIIITTRDVGVLIRVGISDGYNLKGMDRNNGRELFCRHAFNQPQSSNGYEKLVDAFVDVCGGLPLSLQVLGRHIRGKPESFWRSALIQANKTLPQDVKHRLKISFDALSGEEKQIFMDIACFFIGKPKGIAERVWEGSGWNAQHSLQMLKDKCLVEETEIWIVHKKPALRMHDHLRDLGREMASELSTPLRLWRPQDLQYLESMGLKNILAKNDLRFYHSMFDESMRCRVTFFLGQPDICVERSASVLWLELQGTPLFQFQSIPSWVSLQYVQYLKIQHVLLKTLWVNRIQAPSQLKELQIGFCPQLEELSLAHLSCLEEILIDNCYRLKSVSGIHNLTKLGQLNISECPELEELRLPHLDCMEKIAIKRCNHLKSLSGINNLSKLVELEISNCGKLEFERSYLSSMRCVERIIFDRNVEVKYFELNGCQNLKTIEYGYERPAGPGFSYLDREHLLVFEGLICLERIKIDGRGQFKDLVVKDCQNLKSVSGNLENAKLCICACPELEKLPSFSSLNCMEEIDITSCGKLQNIMLPTRLIKLSVRFCKDLQRIVVKGDLLGLKFLCMYVCPELEELPSFSSLNFMEEINVASCGKLQNITVPTRLVMLSLESCRDLQRVVVTGDLLEVKELQINACPELEDLPSFSSLSWMEEIKIDSCEKLQNMAGMEELHVSRIMKLCYWSNADIRNCIRKLKNAPLQCVVIGRAADGAESTLNEYLFSDADAVTEIDISGAENPDNELEQREALNAVSDLKFGSENSSDEKDSDNEDSDGEWAASSVFVLCCLVVVDSSISVERVNKSLELCIPDIKVRQGEWIITVLDQIFMGDLLDVLTGYQIMNISRVLTRYGIMKKGFWVEVKKENEWHMLNTIVDRLHHL